MKRPYKLLWTILLLLLLYFIIALYLLLRRQGEGQLVWWGLFSIGAVAIFTIFIEIFRTQQREIKNLNDKLEHYDQMSQELARKKMDLNLLQNQINPHFLYNTLEAIRGQAELSDEKEIALATEKLGKYFRYCINNDSKPVKLIEELQNIEDYFYIIKFRFLDRIRLDLKIDNEKILQCKLPRMTLQPLVENAINHGLKNKVHDGVVTIQTFLTDKSAYIIVSDNGEGMSDEQQQILMQEIERPLDKLLEDQRGHGVALINVHNRIQLIYGKDYGLRIHSIYGYGTDICIEIPAEIEEI